MLRVTHKERYLGMALLLTWALTHAAVLGDDKESHLVKAKRMLEQPIALNYTGQSLQDVTDYLKEKTKLNVVLDVVALQQLGFFPGIGVGAENNMPVHIKSDKATLRQVLQKTLRPYHLTFVVLQDAVLITTEEGGLAQQVQQRLTINVKDEPLQAALKDIGKAHGINVVFDPRLAKEAQNKVSLELEDATVETAIRLLAELGDMKAVRVGSVVFVTSEARAEKLRKDEDAFRPRQNNGEGIAIPGLGLGNGGAAGVMPPVMLERLGRTLRNMQNMNGGAVDAPAVPPQAAPAPVKDGSKE